MEIRQAYQILGVEEGCLDAEVQETFVQQQRKLESMLAQAPTPGLQEKYRNSLKRLENALETVRLATDTSELPSLYPVAAPPPIPAAAARMVTPPPVPGSGAAAPGTPGLGTAAGGGAPPKGSRAARVPAKPRSHFWEFAAIFLVLAGCGGGLYYWYGIHQPRLAAEAEALRLRTLDLRSQLALLEGQVERLEKQLDKLDADQRDIARLSDEARRNKDNVLLGWAERRSSLYGQVVTRLGESWRVEELNSMVKNGAVLIDSGELDKAAMNIQEMADRIQSLPQVGEAFWEGYQLPLMEISFQDAATAEFSRQYEAASYDRFFRMIKLELSALDAGADADAHLAGRLEMLDLVTGVEDADLGRWRDLLLSRLYLKNPPAQVLAAVRKAVDAYESSNWKEAEVQFWNIARLKLEERPDFHFAFGHTLREVGKMDEAVARLKLAADADHPSAQFMLADLLHSLDRYLDAFPYWEKSARRGIPDAQFAMGAYFYQPFGVTQDFAQAAEWFQKAADQGQVHAQIRLAEMFLDGQGVAKSEATGARLMQAAALQGHPEAEFSLAQLYDEGIGVPLDETEANAWYKKASDQGVYDATYILATRYLEGKGAPKNFATAETWLAKAGGLGFGEAYFLLGNCYENSIQTARNIRTANSWYEKAAGLGHQEASRRSRHLTEAKSCPDCGGRGRWTESYDCGNCYGGSYDCSNCGGSGGWSRSQTVTCRGCNGSRGSYMGYNPPIWINCFSCYGSGTKSESYYENCGSCGGDGERRCNNCGGDGQLSQNHSCSGRCGGNGTYRLIDKG